MVFKKLRTNAEIKDESTVLFSSLTSVVRCKIKVLLLLIRVDILGDSAVALKLAK